MKSRAKHLLTAPQVAKHCNADLKTIHNWVKDGQIRSFRTPGRHLRFCARDVVTFLERFGYPVPAELQQLAHKVVLIIDPDEQTSESLRAGLADQHEIKRYECPVQALLSIPLDQPDLIVSEVELPGVDGYEVVERLVTVASSHVKKRCPVVIFTAADGDEKILQRLNETVMVRKPNAGALRRKVGKLLKA